MPDCKTANLPHATTCSRHGLKVSLQIMKYVKASIKILIRLTRTMPAANSVHKTTECIHNSPPLYSLSTIQLHTLCVHLGCSNYNRMRTQWHSEIVRTWHRSPAIFLLCICVSVWAPMLARVWASALVVEYVAVCKRVHVRASMTCLGHTDKEIGCWCLL